MVLVVFILLFLFSVIVHEVAHGVIARRLGDDTAYRMGRITLDPVKHIDPMMTVLVPVLTYVGSGGGFIFGGAKPVPINPHNLRRPRQAMGWIGASGPTSNILLAFVFTGVVHLLHRLAPGAAAGGAVWVFQTALAYAVLINLFLACFNLIPIPPLDGGRILTALLPADLARTVGRLEPYGIFILVGLLVLGAARGILVPALVLWGLLMPPPVVRNLAEYLGP